MMVTTVQKLCQLHLNCYCVMLALEEVGGESDKIIPLIIEVVLLGVTRMITVVKL